MPTGCPETTMNPLMGPTSESNLHTISPMLTDTHADEARAPATAGVHEEGVSAPTTGVHEKGIPALTTGVREEGVPAPATVEGPLQSTSALPTDASLLEDPPQLANGPAPKKRKVAAPAIISDSISDK
jgi:hypothetical protein